jgi:hypothetical protein
MGGGHGYEEAAVACDRTWRAAIAETRRAATGHGGQ